MASFKIHCPSIYVSDIIYSGHVGDDYRMISYWLHFSVSCVEWLLRDSCYVTICPVGGSNSTGFGAASPPPGHSRSVPAREMNTEHQSLCTTTSSPFLGCGTFLLIFSCSLKYQTLWKQPLSCHHISDSALRTPLADNQAAPKSRRKEPCQCTRAAILFWNIPTHFQLFGQISTADRSFICID